MDNTTIALSASKTRDCGDGTGYKEIVDYEWKRHSSGGEIPPSTVQNLPGAVAADYYRAMSQVERLFHLPESVQIPLAMPAELVR